jgi:hypothetical protein
MQLEEHLKLRWAPMSAVYESHFNTKKKRRRKQLTIAYCVSMQAGIKLLEARFQSRLKERPLRSDQMVNKTNRVTSALRTFFTVYRTGIPSPRFSESFCLSFDKPYHQ